MSDVDRSKLLRLERLQRLREAGALTNEEFDREKAALLARSSGARWIVAGAVIVVMGTALAAFLSFQSIRPHTTEPTANSTAKMKPTALSMPTPTPTAAAGKTIREEPLPEQMIAAFRTAFGRSPPARLTTGDGTRVFRPKRLIWIGDRAVLLSEGSNISDCHSCSGALAIHYLVIAGQHFGLKGAWPDLVRGPGWGAPPQWQVSTKLTSYPAITEEGGFTAQGCTSGGMTITELRPERPIQSGLVRTIMSNDSGYGEPDQIEGHVRNIQKEHSFDVAYSGTRHFAERWTYRADRFELESGQTKMPQC